jgi:hypothetical protein
MFWRCVFGAAALGLAATAAGAAPVDYCKAYAIDFADQTKRDSAYWKQRFDDAQKACLAQYTFTEPVEKAKPQQVAKVKPKANAKPARTEKPVEPAQEESVSLAEAVLPETTPPPPRRKPKLEAGSVAWLDYCDKKYASFNRRTGTYTSHSGVERKCVVSARLQ